MSAVRVGGRAGGAAREWGGGGREERRMIESEQNRVLEQQFRILRQACSQLN